MSQFLALTVVGSQPTGACTPSRLFWWSPIPLGHLSTSAQGAIGMNGASSIGSSRALSDGRRGPRSSSWHSCCSPSARRIEWGLMRRLSNASSKPAHVTSAAALSHRHRRWRWNPEASGWAAVLQRQAGSSGGQPQLRPAHRGGRRILVAIGLVSSLSDPGPALPPGCGDDRELTPLTGAPLTALDARRQGALAGGRSPASSFAHRHLSITC